MITAACRCNKMQHSTRDTAVSIELKVGWGAALRSFKWIINLGMDHFLYTIATVCTDVVKR